MLVAHGTPDEVENARRILDHCKGAETHLHMEEPAAVLEVVKH